MVREVPKKWTHRVHTVIHGDSVGTIFWGSLSLKGRANKYISLKWNHGCESAFLCHLFSERRFFTPRESNYNSMRTHERAENWGDTAGIGCLCRSGYIGANADCTARTAIRCTCSIDHLRLSLWDSRLGLLFGSAFLFVSQIFLLKGCLSCV
jgi:hypothetical protein